MRHGNFNIVGAIITCVIIGSIVSNILPEFLVGVAVLIAFGVFASSYSNKKNTFQSSDTRRTYTSSVRRGDLSSAEITKINVYLRKYFQKYRYLQISEHIQLVVHGSRYSSLSSLDVYQDENYLSSLDTFSTNFPETYDSILKELSHRAAQPVEDEVVDVEASEHTEPKQEAASSVKESQYYIDQLSALNTNIPDEDITNGLYETVALLKQIHSLEEKFPASREKLDKLYEYYLPILTRILEQYENLQNVKSDPSYEETRQKLNKTIHLINDAMKTIIASMTDQDFINLSADISTLEAVLQKDGLAGNNPFGSANKEGKSHE